MLKHVSAVTGLAAGAVIGLVCGVPLGRYLERAEWAWALTRISLRLTAQSVAAVVGWSLLAAAILAGAGAAIWWM